MNMFSRLGTSLSALLLSAAVAQAQAPAAATDVYHVHFTKAAPGQAAALATQLMEQDPKDPMASHFLLLRHQQGDDWDYLLIQHVGQKASVEITPPPPAAVLSLSAWHEDTFVAGPSWAEFSKAMSLAAGASAGSVYVASVHRAVPGHREQLAGALTAGPGGKVPIGHVVLRHLEGGAWTFLSLNRYNSWADFATDETANAAGSGEGWSEIRQHSAYHTDTLASRVTAK